MGAGTPPVPWEDSEEGETTGAGVEQGDSSAGPADGECFMPWRLGAAVSRGGGGRASSVGLGRVRHLLWADGGPISHSGWF